MKRKMVIDSLSWTLAYLRCCASSYRSLEVNRPVAALKRDRYGALSHPQYADVCLCETKRLVRHSLHASSFGLLLAVLRACLSFAKRMMLLIVSASSVE